VEKIGNVHDLFQTTLLWGSLWESVRVADLPPHDYLSLSVAQLPKQTDESLTQSIIAHTSTALHRYVTSDERAKFLPALEKLATARMMDAPDQGLRIIWFRGLRTFAETEYGRDRLKELLSRKLAVPGVELRQLDRWNMVTALIALGDPQADAIFEAERMRDHTGDALKYAYVAEAARPDKKIKQKYLDDYLHNPSRPEDWVEQSLGAFNYWNQSELTEPYLQGALEALPQIKRDRKIFFLVTWLNSFIANQQSPSADEQVHSFLKASEIDRDVRLKILQELDELDRTVQIRERNSEK
jgi:aminopeptidase N